MEEQRYFDRSALVVKPLAERGNKLAIDSMHVDPTAAPGELGDDGVSILGETVARTIAGNNGSLAISTRPAPAPGSPACAAASVVPKCGLRAAPYHAV